MNIDYLKIVIENLTKKYGKNYVYHNFQLIIDNHNINILKSPNGVGKSTLIKIILDITKYQGRVNKNFQIFSYAPEAILLPEYLKVGKFLDLMDIDQVKYAKLLNDFKVNIRKNIGELSKGMKQKILLIQCLLKEADCYIFDEPLNGLDEEAVKTFNNYINELYLKHKLVIIATHQIEKFKLDNLLIINLEELNVN